MVAVGDVYELVTEWSHSSNLNRGLTVWHFRQKAGFTSAINLIAEVRAQIETTWRAMIASEWSIRRYAATSVIPYNTDFYETVLAPPQPGTAGTTGVAAPLAAVFTWRTGNPGRRKRGRSYIVGINRDYIGGHGGLQGVLVSSLGPAFGNKMLSTWGPTGTSATAEFGIWSRLNAGPDPPFDPAGFTPVTSYTLQPAAGTMGSRRYLRGF